MGSADEMQNAPEDVTVIAFPDDASSAVEQAPADALPLGASIGQYVIEGLVGGGGGGLVYAARHRVLGRRVAIKMLRANMAQHPVMVSRFVLEATAVNKIGHPNIVDIHEFGEAAPGRPYYVMELLDGMNLRTYLQVHGRLSPSDMLVLLEPVYRAVQAAHEAGFIHRDIKATNIVIVESNGERVVKLLDFGIAKMFQGDPSDQGLTEPGVQLGTAHHMAPEQIRCDPVDARADVYALGILMYQLLTGQYPFHADDPRQIALLHLQAPAPPPSALAPVAPAVDAVVLRCLEKRAEQRFASVSELVSALRQAVGEMSADPDVAVSAAVGIYVTVFAGGDSDIDDEMFEDLNNVLDSAEQALASHAFAFPLRTSSALLGVRLAADLDLEREQRTVQGLANELRATLAERPGRHAGVAIAITSSLEQSLCRASADGVEIVGGPIFEVDTWGLSRTPRPGP